jgi:general secretion pathway protein C
MPAFPASRDVRPAHALRGSGEPASEAEFRGRRSQDHRSALSSHGSRLRPRPLRRTAIARLTPNLALRLALGAGQLAALYLATHAIGAFMGLRVMADLEEPAAAAEPDEDDDEADDEDDTKAAKKPIPTVKTQPDARVTRITRYNAFCPTCVPSDEVLADAAPVAPLAPRLGPEGEELEPELAGAVATQLPLALLATMEAKAPGISIATISQPEGTGVYAEGEDVMPGVELVAVNLGLVYFRNGNQGGRVEYLQVSSDDPPPPAQAPAEEGEEEEEKPKKNANEIDGASDAISCNGTSCTVERKFVDQLLANPAVLASQGNARPYAKEDLRGFRLSRVKSGTLPRMLGLRSGDVITNINGQPLDSLDGAMKLYAKLRNAAHLTIDVTRNSGGARQEIRLDISII